MQEPYHIKVSLQQYYSLFKSGKWEIPDFSDKCLICGVADCAKYHGNYERRAICPQTGFDIPDLPVGRFLCNDKGLRKKCDHRTFVFITVGSGPLPAVNIKIYDSCSMVEVQKEIKLIQCHGCY